MSQISHCPPSPGPNLSSSNIIRWTTALGDPGIAHWHHKDLGLWQLIKGFVGWNHCKLVQNIVEAGALVWIPKLSI